MTRKSQSSFSLVIHGGAGGSLKKARNDEAVIRFALYDVLEAGRKLLARGGSALDAVTLCVKMLEDNPLFNAGCGAVANAEGKYELDSSIMDGKTLKAGAVASVLNVKNPVGLARLVMEKTPHVLLCGKGANDFARMQKVPMVTQRYFSEARQKAKALLDLSKKHGTVGAVAWDQKGNLAAATSTGGVEGKMPGRIGDSPLIGAGNFADNASAAVSCTGRGEDFIRTSLSSYIGFLVEHEKMDADKAARAALKRLTGRLDGDGGFIMIDKKGNVAAAQSSAVMRWGWIEFGGKTQTTLQSPIRSRKPAP